MFASLVGLIHQPSIAVRVPNDDSTFDPREFSSLAFLAKGKIQGKIRLIHSTENHMGLGTISTRLWVTKENDKDEVSVRVLRENKTLTVIVEGPSRFGSFNIYHETTILIPASTKHMDSLHLESANTSFSTDAIDSLTWGIVYAELSNSGIAVQSLHADTIRLHTSNSSLSGKFDAGHIDLTTSNGSISAKLSVLEAQDGRQSVVKTKTSNAPINLHVDATQTRQGLWMENTTKNGKVVVGALLGDAARPSCLNATSANAKIELNVDASQTGQPLEVNTNTSNATIVSSVMLPAYQSFKSIAQSSNGSVTVNLTDGFQGRFELETSNSPAAVEGSDLQFELDKKSTKRGTRGHGVGNVKIVTSNAAASLRFYPGGESLAADSKMQH
ncbi:hypothetical protein BGZ99_010099 [Dissophora globulifera]|uniref:Uncharacterized protein n=1 Tax=Dissophora globulifera TaxID=979702 RepID=A0A9P6RUV4_9FUNG|nr:hypothetical protein BGZ99_010099 [Dissophora globulifera]